MALRQEGNCILEGGFQDSWNGVYHLRIPGWHIPLQTTSITLLLPVYAQPTGCLSVLFPRKLGKKFLRPRERLQLMGTIEDRLLIPAYEETGSESRIEYGLPEDRGVLQVVDALVTDDGRVFLDADLVKRNSTENHARYAEFLTFMRNTYGSHWYKDLNAVMAQVRTNSKA